MPTALRRRSPAMTTSSVSNTPTSAAPATPSSSGGKQQFGRIVLDISNSVIPLDRLSPTPSAKDGLSEEAELQIRSLGCDLIQLAGKLLKLPQVAMATGCVLFHRFYYAKSFVRLPFDIVAMSSLGLACKIEECPRRTRDIINVFRHIKQVRSGKPIQPVVLDGNYIALKNQVIKAERRVLKELGFCVHVKHPHKIIVMYLKWLEQDTNRELLQMSWNFMNDSLRADVFVRYPPETIAVACIYLSARKLKVPLPKNAAWFEVLGVEEDDIKDCCYRMICLYNRKKPSQDELEALVDNLRRKLDDSRRAARELNASAPSGAGSPLMLTPSASQTASPLAPQSNGQQGGENGVVNAMDGGRRKNYGSAGGARSRSRSPGSRNRSPGSRSRSPGSKKRKKHHRKSRDKSRDRYVKYSRSGEGKNGSRSYDRYSSSKKRRDDEREYYRR